MIALRPGLQQAHKIIGRVLIERFMGTTRLQNGSILEELRQSIHPYK